MRIIATIKDRLERNARQRRSLQKSKSDMMRTHQIQLEYLKIEAQTYSDMLNAMRSRSWSIFHNRKFSLLLAIVAMALYVLGIFYMFREMDLTKVEHWQMAITGLPFWLILTLIPVAVITFLTTRNTRIH